MSENRGSVIPSIQDVAMVSSSTAGSELVVPIGDADEVAAAGALAILTEPAVVASDSATDIRHVTLVEIFGTVAHLFTTIGDVAFVVEHFK